MDPLLSLFSGLLAAFTPCVIVLIPLVLYRFFSPESRKWKTFAFFVLGFILSYLIFAALVSRLFSSTISNGIRLGMGILFILLGILELMGRLNPMKLPVVKSPFILGGVFALAVSMNPCTIPYIGVVISVGGAMRFLDLAMFGLGLLLPALIFAIIGQSFLGFTRKTGKLLSKLNKLMSIVLIASGAYLAISIKSFGELDIYISAIFLFLVFMVLMKLFILGGKKLGLREVFLILALLLIFVAAILHCGYKVRGQAEEITPEAYMGLSAPTCGSVIEGCEICKRCTMIFLGATILGFGTMLFSRKW